MQKGFFTTGTLCGILLFFAGCNRPTVNTLSLAGAWKFHPGDNPEWMAPDVNDREWQEILPDRTWESQGFENLDGYAWYRLKVLIPSSIKKQSYFKDTLLFELGKIDDSDQTFLNGALLGENNRTFDPGTEADTGIAALSGIWNTPRIYKVSVTDPRIRWDEENTLAVRVWDHGGAGGIVASHPRIRMKDIRDYLSLDISTSPFQVEDQTTFEKTVALDNSSHTLDFSGDLEIKVTNNISGEEIFATRMPVTVPKNEELSKSVRFVLDTPVSCTFDARFIPAMKGGTIERSTGVPYILTPPPPKAARIHAPMVFGARPGHPFLYRIPVTGERPVSIKVSGLPEGLSQSSDPHVIVGTTPPAGDYPLRFIASNAYGTDTATMIVKSGDLIALTPPLGWNSWNAWGLSVDDEKVRAAADAFVDNGLADHGWTFINIDDGWEAPERLPDGSITGNEKFPDFKSLSDYIHSKGLKLGIYSGPGPMTCGGYIASYQHEFQDAATWAGWGIDYLKYDWCSYRNIAKDNSLEELQKPYILMRKALDAVNRDIVFSLCQYGMGDVWKWGADVGGNLWRTTGDIRDTWASMSGIGFRQNEMSPFASPGHWNDPDMLVVGWVGWGPNLHPTGLTPDEQYTHITLWALLSAPLLIGCDLTRLDDFTLNLLTNDEVLAVNQDMLGKQADKVYDQGNIQYWLKKTFDGYAAGIFNLNDRTKTVTIKLADLGLDGTFTVRDLWRQADVGTFSDSFSVNIPAHGVMMVRLVRNK